MFPRRGPQYVLLAAMCLTVSACQKSVTQAPHVVPAAVHNPSVSDPPAAVKRDPPIPNHVFTDPATGNSIRIKRVIVDSQGDETEQPDPGMKYVILRVIVRMRQSTAAFNPDDVEVVTRDGALEEQTSMIPQRYHPFDIDVVPDTARRSGDLGFEVPRSARRIRVTWNDDSNLDPPVVVAAYYLP